MRSRWARALDVLRDRDLPADARADDYPPPFPSGWYRVANSDEVRPGQARAVACLGARMILFRGEQGGEVGAIDRHCPHQGADLSVGGEVVDGCIRCPFHHWRFDTGGRVQAIPNVERLPTIRARTWPVRERYGMIFVYHHASGEPRAPDYELAQQPPIDGGSMLHRGEHDAGEVAMHLIEFAENSVDFEHFGCIHGNMLIPWTQLRVPFVDIIHEPSWQIDEAQPHVAYFHDQASLRAFGRPLPRSSAQATITLFGPGGLVWFDFHVPDLGHIKLFQTHTPVAPLRQRVYFRWYADRDMPRALVSYVVGSWVSQWRADIDIWENKIYRRKPKLSRADGPVMRMRRWFQQFYAETA